MREKVLEVTVTKNNLSDYLGINLAELPDFAERLIDRAKEIITLHILNFNETSEEIAAVRNAVCAQVEFFLETDESHDILGGFNEFSVSGFSAKGKIGPLAPRARRFLFLNGLLYAGIGSRNRYD